MKTKKKASESCKKQVIRLYWWKWVYLNGPFVNSVVGITLALALTAYYLGQIFKLGMVY